MKWIVIRYDLFKENIMGRPLRQDTIEAMGLVASGKTLSKKVGYKKYRVKD